MNGVELATADLLGRGMQILRELLGPGWQVTQQQEAGTTVRSDAGAVLELKTPDGTQGAQLLAIQEQHVTPRRAEEALASKAALLRQVNATLSLLVITPWLSSRTRQILREQSIGYIDLTGSAFLRIAQPAIAFQIEGAAKEPKSVQTPSPRRSTLAGSRAGRLVRLLVDYTPPYRAAQLAESAGLSISWVSKLLALLQDQLLIRRDGRVVTDVDWPNLLRARAEAYGLLQHNYYIGMLAPNGLRQVYEKLRSLDSTAAIVTGPQAARAVAPLTSGGQLVLYVRESAFSPEGFGDQLGLLQVDHNADVLLLRGDDTVVFDRPRKIDGITHVALSQLVLDCLSGPGRMPAEGEAVLQYMIENEQVWRLNTLPART